MGYFLNSTYNFCTNFFFKFLEDESVKTVDLSEDSSLWGEGDQNLLDDSAWNGLSLSPDIEQMSAELASKGPPQSEVQLR